MHNHYFPSLSSHSSLQNLSPEERHEWIKNRAYFISEARKESGRPGDATSDWHQASLEIMAQAELEEVALLVFLELNPLATASLHLALSAAGQFPSSGPGVVSRKYVEQPR